MLTLGMLCCGEKYYMSSTTCHSLLHNSRRSKGANRDSTVPSVVTTNVVFLEEMVNIYVNILKLVSLVSLEAPLATLVVSFSTSFIASWAPCAMNSITFVGYQQSLALYCRLKDLVQIILLDSMSNRCNPLCWVHRNNILVILLE